jgi:hypothetical protein
MNLFAWCFISVLLSMASGKIITPDLSHINDKKIWSLINAETGISKQDGQGVMRMKPKGQSTTPSDIGLALFEGLEFGEGTFEIDLKGKGKQLASFLGIAWNVVDGNHFEAVYFRPFNFLRDDAVSRTHAVQYVSWPEYTWEKLRKSKPGVYESAVKPVPNPQGWFHARIEVTKEKVSVWVDDAKEPCLVVDRLANRNKGKVALWVDSKEGEFKNLKITPAK